MVFPVETSAFQCGTNTTNSSCFVMNCPGTSAASLDWNSNRNCFILGSAEQRSCKPFSVILGLLLPINCNFCSALPVSRSQTASVVNVNFERQIRLAAARLCARGSCSGPVKGPLQEDRAFDTACLPRHLINRKDVRVASRSQPWRCATFRRQTPTLSTATRCPA